MVNELSQKIISILETFVGKIVAQATVQTQCVKLGKSLDSIDRTDINPLAELIGTAMSAFGKDGDSMKDAINSI